MLRTTSLGPITRLHVARGVLGRSLRTVDAYLIDGLLIKRGFRLRLPMCSHAGFVGEGEAAIEQKTAYWEGVRDEARALREPGWSVVRGLWAVHPPHPTSPPRGRGVRAPNQRGEGRGSADSAQWHGLRARGRGFGHRYGGAGGGFGLSPPHPASPPGGRGVRARDERSGGSGRISA